MFTYWHLWLGNLFYKIYYTARNDQNNLVALQFVRGINWKSKLFPPNMTLSIGKHHCPFPEKLAFPSRFLIFIFMGPWKAKLQLQSQGYINIYYEQKIKEEILVGLGIKRDLSAIIKAYWTSVLGICMLSCIRLAIFLCCTLLLTSSEKNPIHHLGTNVITHKAQMSY